MFFKIIAYLSLFCLIICIERFVRSEKKSKINFFLKSILFFYVIFLSSFVYSVCNPEKYLKFPTKRYQKKMIVKAIKKAKLYEIF